MSMSEGFCRLARLTANVLLMRLVVLVPLTDQFVTAMKVLKRPLIAKAVKKVRIKAFFLGVYI